MDKYETHELLLYFKHRGQQVHFTASAKGWAQMWLRKNPYTVRTHHSKSTDKQHQEYDVSHIGCWIEPGRLSNAYGSHPAGIRTRG